jgi:hypothetical protein
MVTEDIVALDIIGLRFIIIAHTVVITDTMQELRIITAIVIIIIIIEMLIIIEKGLRIIKGQVPDPATLLIAQVQGRAPGPARNRVPGQIQSQAPGLHSGQAPIKVRETMSILIKKEMFIGNQTMAGSSEVIIHGRSPNKITVPILK